MIPSIFVESSAGVLHGFMFHGYLLTGNLGILNISPMDRACDADGIYSEFPFLMLNLKYQVFFYPDVARYIS
jgi:hypothetical protein